MAPYTSRDREVDEVDPCAVHLAPEAHGEERCLDVAGDHRVPAPRAALDNLDNFDNFDNFVCIVRSCT